MVIWKNSFLHLWSVERTLLTMVIIWKRVSYIGDLMGRMLLILVVGWKNASYVGGHLEEGFLHWWPGERGLLTLVV